MMSSLPQELHITIASYASDLATISSLLRSCKALHAALTSPEASELVYRMQVTRVFPHLKQQRLFATNVVAQQRQGNPWLNLLAMQSEARTLFIGENYNGTTSELSRYFKHFDCIDLKSMHKTNKKLSNDKNQVMEMQTLAQELSVEKLRQYHVVIVMGDDGTFFTNEGATLVGDYIYEYLNQGYNGQQQKQQQQDKQENNQTRSNGATVIVCGYAQCSNVNGGFIRGKFNTQKLHPLPTSRQTSINETAIIINSLAAINQVDTTNATTKDNPLRKATIESLTATNANDLLRRQQLFLYEGIHNCDNLAEKGIITNGELLTNNDDHGTTQLIDNPNAQVLSCFNDQCLTPAVTIAKHKQEEQGDNLYYGTIIGFNNFPGYLSKKKAGVNYLCNVILLAAAHSMNLLGD